MRKNILFIAKFDNVLKGMNAILSKTFNMQMCPPSPEMLEKTFDVMELDLVLFYLSGLSGMQIMSLCNKLATVCLTAPIVIFGSTEECDDFRSKYFQIKVKGYLYRPLTTPKIAEALCGFLKIKTNTVQMPDTTPDIAPTDTTAGTTTGVAPDAAPNTTARMSIADFADSLEADERRCVLVVDDSGVILRAMKMLLEKDYKVNLANSAKTAHESIKRERPDVILLDYEMPEVDGKQFLEQLRINPVTYNIPVFFLTGVSDKERIKEVVSLKPQGYFLKSSNPNIILDALNALFNKL